MPIPRASPRSTGTLFVLVLAGAVTLAALYRRRVWCRFLCPIGALTGLYAMTSAVELRPSREICRDCSSKACFLGNQRGRGCPFWEFPGALETNRNCNLCGNCIRVCPSDSLSLRLRVPLQELWRLRRPALPEAVLAVVMVGVVYVQTIDMTVIWSDYMKWILEWTPLFHYNLAFTLTLLVAVGLVLGSYLLAAWLSSRWSGERLVTNLSRFGYAYLPLAVGGHLGHNLSHLAGEGGNAVNVTLQGLGLAVVLFQTVERPEGVPVPPDPVALVIVVAGIAGSLYATWRLGRRDGLDAGRNALPHLVLLAVLSLLFAQMFLVPMNPRHAH